MRAKEFLNLLEASLVTLTPGDLLKDIGRFDNFVADITSGNPLYKADGTAVIIDPTEANRVQQMFDNGMFRGHVVLKTQDGGTEPLNAFLKTKRYGGMSVPPTPAAAGQAAQVPGSVRPGMAFGMQDVGKDEKLTTELALQLGAFPANQLAKRIEASDELDRAGRDGQAIKMIAAEMDQGNPAMVPVFDPPLTPAELSNIQNYGFEYLGVLALVKGTADFPNADAFYQHVGINPAELVLYFPGNSSNPIADSYALVNKQTENSIYISSKGAKGGAPSSISALKIPDTMKKMIGKDPAITFINTLQTNSKPAWVQPFVGADWLEENFPGSMGPLAEFLPFSDELLVYCSSILKTANNGVPETLDQIDPQFQPLFKLVDDSVSSKHPLFYNLRYYIKDRIHEAVRKGVIPNFSKRMIELLGQNFVLLSTERKKNQFVTHVKWPSKVGGKVTLEHKDPAPKWGSSMTWKLS